MLGVFVAVTASHLRAASAVQFTCRLTHAKVQSAEVHTRHGASLRSNCQCVCDEGAIRNVLATHALLSRWLILGVLSSAFTRFYYKLHTQKLTACASRFSKITL